jgi:hypothetical protein
MGLMTELFVSTPAEAGAFGHATSESFERVELGGLTSLEFEVLWAILAEEEWDPNRHTLSSIASDEEWWTFQFPAAYVKRLVESKPTDARAAAVKWAASDEMSAEAEDVEPVIEQLIAIASSAQKQGKALFLWVSL